MSFRAETNFTKDHSQANYDADDEFYDINDAEALSLEDEVSRLVPTEPQPSTSTTGLFANDEIAIHQQHNEPQPSTSHRGDNLPNNDDIRKPKKYGRLVKVSRTTEPEEVFHDAVQHDMYWTCDEEKLEIYSAPYDSSDDEKEIFNYGKKLKLSGGRTLLQIANSVKTVKKLVYLGHDINETDWKVEGPLQYGVGGRLDVIEGMIKAGANVNATNKYGQTPLAVALDLRSGMPTIRALLIAGADVGMVLQRYGSYVMTRAWNGELVQLLVYHGAKVNTKDRSGMTHLHHACWDYRKKIKICAIREMIRCGADVNGPDYSGRPPLYYAVCALRCDAIAVLMENGADVTIECADYSFSDRYCTPLDKALRFRMGTDLYLVKYIALNNRLSKPKFLDLQWCYLKLKKFEDLQVLLSDCVTEISVMVSHRIGLYSLFDYYRFMVEYNRIKPIYTHIDLGEQIKDVYPIYADVILPKIQLCVERGKILSKLMLEQVSFGSLQTYVEEAVYLNFHSMSMIFEYLSNQDLINIVSICDMEWELEEQ